MHCKEAAGVGGPHVGAHVNDPQAVPSAMLHTGLSNFVTAYAGAVNRDGGSRGAPEPSMHVQVHV